MAESYTRLIDENQRLRAELARLGPLAEVGLLSAGAAHDLNNLLQLVAGHAALLQPAAAAERDALRRLHQATESACELAQRLGRWARDEARGSAATALAPVVRQVAELTEPVAPLHAELRLELAETLPDARIDAGHAHRIVLNLMLNAWHALRDGTGVVIVRTGAHEPDRVWVEVEDDGAGMDESVRLRLFEPFFSAHPEGSGLGLVTIRSLTDAAGGAIEVWSATGRGSRFRVTLPAAPLSAPEPA